MKRYKVIFTTSAKEDIFKSYEWGCREWGKVKAQHWAGNLHDSVEKVLTIFPSASRLHRKPFIFHLK